MSASLISTYSYGTLLTASHIITDQLSIIDLFTFIFACFPSTASEFISCRFCRPALCSLRLGLFPGFLFFISNLECLFILCLSCRNESADIHYSALNLDFLLLICFYRM